MPYLKHSCNGETLTVIELGEQAVIGRHQQCDIIINDPTVSAQHARVSKAGDGYLLTDLHSTNGVRIHGELTASTALTEGCVFELGTHAFQFLTQLPTDLDRTLKIKKSWIPGLYYTK